MKRNVAAIAIFALLSGAAVCGDGGERERTFVRALEIFDQAKKPEDFRQAAALLEGLLRDGYQNGAVYCNIGNAYMRAGDCGKAIAAYRKAKLYRPRDPYLDANLRQALMVAPGRLPDPPAPWWKSVLFWNTWLSLPEKFHATAGAFVLAALVAMTALLLRRKRLYWLSGGIALIALVLTVDAALTYGEVNFSRRAVIVAETVARKGMGNNYEPAFDKPLRDGAEFTIIDRSGTWLFGHFEGIGDGWVRRESVVE